MINDEKGGPPLYLSLPVMTRSGAATSKLFRGLVHTAVLLMLLIFLKFWLLQCYDTLRKVHMVRKYSDF